MQIFNCGFFRWPFGLNIGIEKYAYFCFHFLFYVQYDEQQQIVRISTQMNGTLTSHRHNSRKINV